jgi:hypothetical protein
MPEPGPIEFQCCFCARGLAASAPDLVMLVVPLEDGGSQELRCHSECLRRAVHPTVPLAV